MEATELAEAMNKGWGVEGFNNHEEQALKVGYVDEYFPEYLPLKLELLKRRDSSGGNVANIRFFNALRIYTYTIFENLWFGYLISYSQMQESSFVVNERQVSFLYPYLNHLPSFSAAVMHFGTCRDLFFILLKLCVDPQMVKDRSKIDDLLHFRYNNWESFKEDLAKLSNSNDPKYVNGGLEVFNVNEFRNFFAHRMRLLWWHNRKCSPIDYFMKRDVYEAVRNKKKKYLLDHVYSILEDPKSYENEINKSVCSDLVGSGEILRGTHDVIASFANKSFMFVRKKLPQAI